MGETYLLTVAQTLQERTTSSANSCKDRFVPGGMPPKLEERLWLCAWPGACCKKGPCVMDGGIIGELSQFGAVMNCTPW